MKITKFSIECRADIFCWNYPQKNIVQGYEQKMHFANYDVNKIEFPLCEFEDKFRIFYYFYFLKLLISGHQQITVETAQDMCSKKLKDT